MNNTNALNDVHSTCRCINHSGYLPCLIIFLLFHSSAVFAQNAQDLSKLSKEELISLASSKISEASFRVSDFTEIEVWLEDNELTVEFGYVIRFIPKRGQYYYSVSVELVSGSSSRSIKGNGPGDEDIQFYNPQKFKDEIKFVLEAINKSDGEVGKIPEGKLPEGSMTIQEEFGYYDISVDSYSTHSSYKIKKDSGRVYDASHKHYYRDNSESRRKKIY